MLKRNFIQEGDIYRWSRVKSWTSRTLGLHFRNPSCVLLYSAWWDLHGEPPQGVRSNNERI